MQRFQNVGFVLLAVLIAAGAFSCDREVRFDNWLTQGEGTWNVTTLRERFIEFPNATDSIPGPYLDSAPEASTFSFRETGTLAYFFFSEALGAPVEGSGDYAVQEEQFSYFAQVSSLNAGPIETQIQGTKLSRDEMQIDLRVAYKDAANRLTLAHALQFRTVRAE
ncbi:MAG: hypothetical protein AAGN35_09160 [Bacteroidota bacterium]